VPTYQWMADGVVIVGETAQTLALDAGDVGAMISCTVTLTSPYGTDDATAVAVGPVTASSYPATVADARALFDADTIGLADGANVNTWSAVLGALDATGGTNKPILKTAILNGRDIVRAVTNQSMTLPAGLTSGLTGVDGATVIYVGKGSASIGGGPLFGNFGTDGAVNHYPWTDNAIYEDFMSTVRKNAGNFNSRLQSFHVGTLRSKTNLWDLRLNKVGLLGPANFNTVSNGFGANASPLLFSNGSSFWNGDLAWWALFDRYLSDVEVAEWEDFLGTLFGINPPAPVSARYHRMRTTGNYSGSSWKAIIAREVEFRATVGGAKLAGTLTGSNVQAGNVGSNAYDGNLATIYQGGSGFGTATETLTLDLGAGNDSPVLQFGFTPQNTGDGLVYSPSGFVMETSPDNATWSENYTVSGITFAGWVDNVLRTFDRPT
jgi:hypothetical protein